MLKLKVNISISAFHYTLNAFMQGSLDSSVLPFATRSSTGTSPSTFGMLPHQRRISKPVLPSSSLSWSRDLIASSSVSNEVKMPSICTFVIGLWLPLTGRYLCYLLHVVAQRNGQSKVRQNHQTSISLLLRLQETKRGWRLSTGSVATVFVALPW